MHFVLFWTADNPTDEATAAAIHQCFADYGSAEPFPRFHVIQISGHGHQERIHQRLKQVCADRVEQNISFLISPLIIGGNYQGRLFEADLASRVNALTMEDAE